MKPWFTIFLFLLGGAGFGCLYYWFFGCSGSCPITSDPFRTIAYFSITGILAGILCLPEKAKKKPCSGR